MERESDEEHTAEELKAERRRVREERKRIKAEREEAERLRVKAERLRVMEERRRMYAIERDYFDDATPAEIAWMWGYIRAADRYRGGHPYFTKTVHEIVKAIPWSGPGQRFNLLWKLESQMQALGLIRVVDLSRDEWQNGRAVIVRVGLSPAPVARTDAEVDAVERLVRGKADALAGIELRAYGEPEPPPRTIEAATVAELLAELVKRVTALERLAATG